MNQIQAIFTKTIKEFLREKVVLFWTVAWPILWVLLGSFAFTGGASQERLPYIRGSVTIPMMVFALMIAGMANIPSSIGQDRERGLLSKLRSMPLSPWKDFLGRFFALLTFSVMAVILVGAVGYAAGARISGSFISGLESAGFLLVAVLASAGIGMLIGTFVKNVNGATMTGVGISVLSAAISGVMIPYSILPGVLQGFSRVYPVSSVNSLVIYLMIGEESAGYNPMTVEQVVLTVVMAVILFAAGLIAYSKLSWKRA
jgi:ABC-2 type transport system permease protein